MLTRFRIVRFLKFLQIRRWNKSHPFTTSLFVPELSNIIYHASSTFVGFNCIMWFQISILLKQTICRCFITLLISASWCILRFSFLDVFTSLDALVPYRFSALCFCFDFLYFLVACFRALVNICDFAELYDWCNGQAMLSEMPKIWVVMLQGCRSWREKKTWTNPKNTRTAELNCLHI